MNSSKFNKIIFFLFIVSVTIAGCKKGNSPKPSPPVTAQPSKWPGNADVYFVGMVNEAGTVWKNGVPTSLANPLGNSSVTPEAIAVSNNDVYIVGEAGIESHSEAVCWKNGVETRLAPNLGFSEARAITINGSDIYIAGMIGNKATLWKNGVATTLTSTNSEAIAVCVDGNDIYLAGFSFEGNVDRAALWKNGERVTWDISNALYGSYANAVKVDGDNVYVAGVIIGKGPALWKNDVAKVLYDGGALVESEVTDMAINGSDVYVLGRVEEKVTLWKNGVAETMPLNDKNTIPSKVSIGFDGNDVYIAGGLDNNNSPASIYWLNSVAYQFSTGLCTINGLAIAKH
jgi:hypothetical protein